MEPRIIRVKFDGNTTEYSFYCFIEVYPGDLVVVDTVNGLKLATVTTLEGKIPVGRTGREVVNRVDMTDFNNRREREKRLNELKVKMDKRVKDLEKIAVYEMLSEKDPELKEMLSELKSLL